MTGASEHEKFEGWAILELMGHRRLAGYVTETELAGQGTLRLDVPIHEAAVCTCGSSDPDSLSHEDHTHDCMVFQPDEQRPSDVHATQFYSPTALYCLTPTTEMVARGLAAKSRPAPVHRWELEPAEPRVTAYFVQPEGPDEHTEAEWAEVQQEGSPTHD